jgi:hypothetical protein
MNAEAPARLVRRWVAVYTRGLPAAIRQDRRDEVEDDLWSQMNDAAQSGRSNGSVSGEIVMRLLFGVPADVTWRVEQGRLATSRAAPERGPVMNLRGVGVLAIVGGVGWAIWPIPQALVGRDWPINAPVSWLLLFSVFVGTWALAGATIGLEFRFQDRLRGIPALLGSLGAAAGGLSVLGAYVLIVFLPLGSAALMWELGRVGAMSNLLSRAHVASAILALIVFAVLMANVAILDTTAVAVPLLSLVIPYALSWIAIGWSLRHRVPMPEGGAATGAS